MNPSCVDPVLEFLEQLVDEYDAESVVQVKSLHLELKFFKMFLIGMAYQEGVSDDYWHSVLSTMVYKLNQTVEQLSMQCQCASNEELIDNWELLSFPLRKRINKFKPKIREICILLLDGAFRGMSFQFQEAFLEYSVHTTFLINLITENVRALALNMDLTAPVKEQVAFIQGKLEVFGKFSLTTHDSSSVALRFGKVICQNQAWVGRISCLTTLYWVDEMDERLGSVVGNMLSDLMQMYMPRTPGVLSMYLDMFMDMRSHIFQSDSLISQHFLKSYADYLLEHFVVHTKKDTEILENFRHGLICLLSLEMDSLKKDLVENNILFKDIYGIIKEVPSAICSTEMNIPGLVQRIVQVLKEFDVFQPLSSEFISPTINVIGFLDSLIRNLRKMLVRKTGLTPFIRDHIEMVREELVTLQYFLQFRLELEAEQEVVGNLCARIANVVYFAAYVTNLCSGTSFWVSYGIICLPDLIEDIKIVKSEVVGKIGEGWIYSQESHTSDIVKSSKALLPQATTSRNEGTFIGYEQDAEEILNHLVRGTKELRIISISGMPGQGKTTLAKRMYNDPSVHLHFHQKVWCYVSKECNMKALLVSIAQEIGCSVDVSFEIQDLIECVCRSLRGKRYLVIMDDIWDVDVWRQIGGSFPNDVKGSRVLFTSRSHDLASKAEPNSVSCRLRPFTDEESWTLMKKVSNCDGLPEAFLDIGEQIAVYCKGLPLAVVLIASHLKRVGHLLIMWKQAAENLKLHLADEGCMHVIELSFRYLPDHLKQCFLYFGAFPRGENVRVRKLKLLWIAEGFLKENGMQCLDDLGNEYLDILVSQSLVVVTERSSTGWIKSCNVHDLLYDLCFERGVQDNFVYYGNTVSDAQLYDNHHRLCMYKYGPSTLPKSISNRKNLPTSKIHTLLYDSDPLELESLSSFLGKFKVLTVLDLKAIIWDTFADILSNVHLRYLAVFVGLSDIPPSIADLWNLETLIMTGYDCVLQLPDTLWEMESLKYVCIQKSRLKPSTKPSISIAARCNIEVLKGIILNYDFKTEEFLGRLVHLKKLRCYVGDHDSEVRSLWFSMFGSLEKLESLHIQYSRGILASYHELPTFKFPNNVKKLTLKSSQLPWSVMSVIGKLPNLEVLKLRNGACSGSTWHLGDGDFLKLRCLRLSQMNDVEQIDDSDCEDPFPCLEELLLVYCRNLKEVPGSFGDICTLDTIDITDSPNLCASVKRIVEQQLDMGNNYLRVLGLEDDHTDDEAD